MIRTYALIVCVLIALIPLACSNQNRAESSPETAPVAAQPITPQHLQDGPIHNLHQLAPDLYSGGEPPESEHYAQLAAMGIRTVVSVDAIPPNPDLAAPYGIRIVHLPIGYDGISDERAVELAAALDTLEHPIYVHCHHGKHRGPAALCVGAIGAGLITNTQAQDYMKVAGTSARYSGLWEAADHAVAFDKSTLHAVHDLPARAPVPGYIKAMGHLDRLHDQIWEMAEDDWKAPEDHPDLTPDAVSGQIHDLLRSLLDSEYVTKEGAIMRHEMEKSIDAASTIERRIDSNDWAGATEALEALGQTCRSCHDQFRD